MVRIFNVYVPTRLLILMVTEPLIIFASFLLAVIFCIGSDSFIVLGYQDGIYKVLAITAFTILGFDLFDLYDLDLSHFHKESNSRLLVVLGLVCCFLAGVGYLFPQFLLGKGSLIIGVVIVTFALSGWRGFYAWLVRQPYFREPVYVLGSGEWADEIVNILRTRPELGMELVGWIGATGGELGSNGSLGQNLLNAVHKSRARRIIVAMRDRRSRMPIRELLELKLTGVKIEDASTIYQRVTGKIDVDSLVPSSLVFGGGFRLNPAFLLARRVISIGATLVLFVLFLPLVPFFVIAIKLTSPGPVLYRQKRVGLKGKVFTIFKFRTMRRDAESSTGATWAQKDDPRITRLGHWLRNTRLDEIPQLWNVFRGDMEFVGPRPERPEFVEVLVHKVPYYTLRHVIRPGVTGWAQVCYEYGASIEGAKEKLKYDVYYIKNMGLGFDLFIILRSLKVVLLGRGAR